MKTTTIVVAAVAIVAVAAIVGAYLGLNYLSQPIIPTQFAYANVDGSPSQGFYTVIFSLMDQSQKSGAADGSIYLRIIDGRDNILFEKLQSVNAADYVENTNILGRKIMVYSFTIPASSVGVGYPVPAGYNKAWAKMTFTTKAGQSFSSGDSTVTINTPPTIRVIEWHFTSNYLTGQVHWSNPWDFAKPDVYVNDTVQIVFTLINDDGKQINNIACTTQGFTLISVNRTMPFTVSSSEPIMVQVKVPSQAYEGDLSFRFDASAPQYGSMSFDTYQVQDNTHVIVWIRNTGTKSLTLGTVYIDGIQATLSPSPYTIGVGESHQFTVIGSGTHWADGQAHQFRIIATDGTPLQFSIIKT